MLLTLKRQRHIKSSEQTKEPTRVGSGFAWTLLVLLQAAGGRRHAGRGVTLQAARGRWRTLRGVAVHVAWWHVAATMRRHVA